MDIDNLRYFVGLANELNFSKTAETFFISQPTLSRRITALENELGMQLFYRTHNMVVLTPEGEVILEKAYLVIKQYDDMLFTNDELKKHLSANLKIRYSSQHVIDHFYFQIKQKLEQEYPNIHMALEFGPYTSNLEALQRGETDAVFSVDGALETFKYFEWEPIFHVRHYVLVPNSHPLANRDAINLSELSDERFISLSRENSPSLFDLRKQMCADNGFIPNIVLYCNSVIDVMLHVSLGDGVSLMLSEGVEDNTSFGTKAVPVIGKMDDVYMSIVWSKKNQSHALEIFVRALKEASNLINTT